MTNQFVSILSNVTYTENEMVTNKSSLNPHLDLFYRVGNRSKDATVKFNPILFVAACQENEDLAVKIMGWSRSVRNGAGVREHLRSVLKGIKNNEKVDWEWFGREGYWKDIFYFDPSYFNSIDSVLAVIKTALAHEDNLLLKYLPRVKKNKAHKNNKWIKILREALHLSPKEYRKICSSFVTPEAIMCRKEWNKLDYGTIPSVCMHRNLKHFYKHDEGRIREYINAVKEGKTIDGKKAKINVGTLYPHQIIMPLLRYFSGWNNEDKNWVGNVSKQLVDIAEAQWSQLPTKFNSNKKILVVGDTSRSMNGEPIAISIALSIYCAESITGAFHNFCCTFSERPSFIKFEDTDTIVNKIRKIPKIVANTNIEAVFDLMLYKAVSENIPKEDMPEMVIIISDMQFDSAVTNRNFNIQELVRDKYQKAGYEVPALVFWNVRDSHGIPARANDKGIILFSGASANSISQAIEGEIDPMAAMLKVVDKPEFNWVK